VLIRHSLYHVIYFLVAETLDKLAYTVTLLRLALGYPGQTL